ncbi:MAG: hypothetical protein JNM70_13620 [Anaerolineae bacterium]|nr:hypothetical protein [Anaerolineae bacterium]
MSGGAFAPFRGFAFAAFRPVSRTGSCDLLTQNGDGGVSAIAAISATKPGHLPVGNRSAVADVSQNRSFTPPPTPSFGAELLFRNCRNCRNCRNKPSGMDDISDNWLSLAISYTDNSQDSHILILTFFIILHRSPHFTINYKL